MKRINFIIGIFITALVMTSCDRAYTTHNYCLCNKTNKNIIIKTYNNYNLEPNKLVSIQGHSTNSKEDYVGPLSTIGLPYRFEIEYDGNTYVIDAEVKNGWYYESNYHRYDGPEVEEYADIERESLNSDGYYPIHIYSIVYTFDITEDFINSLTEK